MSKTVEIHASIGKIILLIAGAIGFVIGGGFLIAATDIFGAIIGLATIAFFGLCGAIGVWRLFTLRGTVVEMSRKGIRDIRVAPEIVPWREVKEISTWRGSGQKIMVLHVDQDVWDGLSLTEIARRSQSMNSALGADGIPISSTELQTSHEALVTTAMEFWNASRRR